MIAMPSSVITRMADIDWDAAITALAKGGLPRSGGERRILQLSASLAAGTPVSLRDTTISLGNETLPTSGAPRARS